MTVAVPPDAAVYSGVETQLFMLAARSEAMVVKFVNDTVLPIILTLFTVTLVIVPNLAP